MVTVTRGRKSVRPSQVLVSNGRAQTPCFFDGLDAVLVRNPVLADDDLGVDTRRVDVADDFDDSCRPGRGPPSASV